MGQVHRARDLRTGKLVAVKLLSEAGPGSAQAARFADEGGVLAELEHENVVGYVAHGADGDGTLFLAMELLEGEDLSARLERGPLSIRETLEVARQTALALDAAHRRGIVHRDLKPSNLFLKGGAAERLSVLDFGIARRGEGRALTRTGAIVGTPEYMAPEQAQGQKGVGPQADVFSLGCVLYHALSGRPPFAGEHVVATLAKIVFEAPEPVEARRPDTPAALATLIERMLEKRPEARPRDAGEVLSALSVIAVPEAGASSTPRPIPSGLGSRELELVSVIVISRSRPGEDDTLDAALVSRARENETLDAAPGAGGTTADALRGELASRGIASELLADGSIVAQLLPRGGSAIDQALDAALAARLARARWPEATIAIATATSVAGGAIPVGEALDRASALLSRGATPAGVWLDEATARLIEGRLRTTRAKNGGATLHDEPLVLDEQRPLLRKPTPCVGREQELSLLDLTLASCFDERRSQAVLVVAPPGLGKSRLKREFLRRIEARTDRILTLEARGEPLRSGSPCGLLAQSLKALLAVDESAPLDLARAGILDAVMQLAPGPEASTVAEFVGELCAVPFPDEDSVKLRTARQDPKLMQVSLNEALVTLLRGACEGAGVLVLLEDLHWGDRASIEIFGRLLRELEDEPLFFVAFARPELLELNPDLWKGRVTRLPLRPLSKRACERLAERVAGDRLDRTVIARLAEQSDGNALFLEELIRSACEGDAGARPPETVMAMLQARVGRLGPGERRALRAASVFGERFYHHGLSAVLGLPATASEVDRLLEALRGEELVEDAKDRKGELKFRHALMREAAYSLLTEEDRRTGHRLAASFLAGKEHDPAVVAEHFSLANDPDQAGRWFLDAAQVAFDRDDFTALDALASKARAAGVKGEALGGLAALEAFGSILRWDWDRAAKTSDEALAGLQGGGRSWCLAMRAAVQLKAYRNEHDKLAALVPGPCSRVCRDFHGRAHPVVHEAYGGKAELWSRSCCVGREGGDLSPGVCIFLDKPSKHRVIFTRAYSARPRRARERPAESRHEARRDTEQQERRRRRGR